MNILSKFLSTRALKNVLIDRNRDRHHPESGRITQKDIHTIFEDTLNNFNRLIQNVNMGPTVGSRIMVRNGVLSQALYQAIRKFGADKEYATELCADVLWKRYKNQVSIQRLFAHLLSRDPQKQMNILQKIFLFFPLTRPGYEWQLHETGAVVAYDIYRCPVCDYFKTQSQEEYEFFRNSWCTFDFPIAEYLVKGGRYERQQTLSAGDTRCDMRWMSQG